MLLQEECRHTLFHAFVTGLLASAGIWKPGPAGSQFGRAVLKRGLNKVKDDLELLLAGWRAGEGIEAARASLTDVLLVLTKATSDVKVR